MSDPFAKQRAELRRTQILEAAETVFAEKGFHRTTIRDIAQAAGVADGTIYNYFESKTALLFSLLDKMTEETVSADDLAQLAEADLRTFLIAYLRYPLMAGDSALFRVIMPELMVNDELREAYQREVLTPSLAQAQAALSRFDLPTDPALTVRALSALVMGLLMQRIMGDATLNAHWQDLPTLLADLLLNGIGGAA